MPKQRPSTETKAREAKVVLLGDTGVGKSSLVRRFVTNNFKPYSESTIGASFLSKMILVDGNPIKFQIWDTAGQEKYHSLAPMYYRNAAAAIIVYDITKKNTFKTLKSWIEELKMKGPENIVICVVGNKSDKADEREVSADAAQAYADEIGAMFFETSAKDDINVQKVFIDLSKIVPTLPAETRGDQFVIPSSRIQDPLCC